jgi:ATP-dependent Clp protease ATP-binding subunit ClpA
MTLTPRAKRVIDLAYDCARNLNNNYIGTEHLLLGLIREGDGLAGRVLDKLGVKFEKAVQIVTELQREEGMDTPPWPGATEEDRDLVQGYMDRVRRATTPRISPDEFKKGDLGVTLLLACMIEDEGAVRSALAIATVDFSTLFNALRYARAVTAKPFGLETPTLTDYLAEGTRLAADPSLLGSGQMTDVDLFLAVLKMTHAGLKTALAIMGLDYEMVAAAVRELRAQAANE